MEPKDKVLQTDATGEYLPGDGRFKKGIFDDLMGAPMARPAVRPSSVDRSKYAKYLPAGFSGDDPLLDKKRALSQSTWEQAGNTAGRLLPGIAGFTLEGIGGIAAGVEWLAGDKDWQNSFTRAGEAIGEWKDDAFPIYREDPSKVIDLADPAWWLHQMGAVAESAIPFAIGGMGAGMLMGRAAGAAANAVGASARAARIAQMSAQGMTAAGLAFTEGAMEAKRVYEEVYEKAHESYLARGVDPMRADEMARVDAAQGASKTVIFDTVANTGLNITALGAAFKGFSRSRQLQRAMVDRAPGEDVLAYINRLRKTEEGKSYLGYVARRLGIEGAQESAEEVNNELASYFGSVDGMKASGADPGKLNGWELLNAAISGAMGGVAQTTLTDVVPWKKHRFYDFDQKVWGQERMGAAKATFLQDQAAQEFLVGSVARRIERTREIQAEMASIVSGEGDASPAESEARLSELQSELFQMADADAISSGTEALMIAHYDEIANLSPEDARARGFSVTDPTDPEDYRYRANERKRSIEELTAEYEDLERRLNYDEAALGYLDYVFSLRHGQQTRQEAAANFRRRAEKAEEDVDRMRGDASGTVTPLLVRIARASREKAAVESALSKIGEDHPHAVNLRVRLAEIEADEKTAREELTEKYKQAGISEAEEAASGAADNESKLSSPEEAEHVVFLARALQMEAEAERLGREYARAASKNGRVEFTKAAEEVYDAELSRNIEDLRRTIPLTDDLDKLERWAVHPGLPDDVKQQATERASEVKAEAKAAEDIEGDAPVTPDDPGTFAEGPIDFEADDGLFPNENAEAYEGGAPLPDTPYDEQPEQNNIFLDENVAAERAEKEKKAQWVNFVNRMRRAKDMGALDNIRASMVEAEVFNEEAEQVYAERAEKLASRAPAAQAETEAPAEEAPPRASTTAPPKEQAKRPAPKKKPEKNGRLDLDNLNGNQRKHVDRVVGVGRDKQQAWLNALVASLDTGVYEAQTSKHRVLADRLLKEKLGAETQRDGNTLTFQLPNTNESAQEEAPQATTPPESQEGMPMPDTNPDEQAPLGDPSETPSGEPKGSGVDPDHLPVRIAQNTTPRGRRITDREGNPREAAHAKYRARDFRWETVGGDRIRIESSNELTEDGEAYAHPEVFSPGSEVQFRVDTDYAEKEGLDPSDAETAPIGVWVFYDEAWHRHGALPLPSSLKLTGTKAEQARELKKLRHIRKMAVEQGSVTSTVEDRSTGNVSKAHVFGPEGEPIFEDGRQKIERLPVAERPGTESWEIAVMGEDDKLYGKGGLIDEQTYHETKTPSQTYILVPVPGSTRRIPLPLWQPPVAEYAEQVWGLIEGLASEEKGEAVANAVGRKTFDIRYILDVLYSSSFTRETLNESGPERVHVHIGEDSKVMKVALGGKLKDGTWQGIVFTTSPEHAEGTNYRYMFEKRADGSYRYKDAVMSLLADLRLKPNIEILGSTKKHGLTYLLGKDRDGKDMTYEKAVRQLLLLDVNVRTIEIEGLAPHVTPFEQQTVTFSADVEPVAKLGDEGPAESASTEILVKGPSFVYGGLSPKGRGTPIGDEKDQRMRAGADSSIVELDGRDRESSSRTTHRVLGAYGSEDKPIYQDLTPAELSEYNRVERGPRTGGVVMLARNGSLRGKPLRDETVEAVKRAHEDGAFFIIGDMPGVDEPFIRLLDEIGGVYTVYHAGADARVKLKNRLYMDTEPILSNSGTEIGEEKVGKADEHVDDEGWLGGIASSAVRQDPQVDDESLNGVHEKNESEGKSNTRCKI